MPVSNLINTPPVNAPAECLDIDPESLVLANTYLQNPDINAVASDLDISVELVTQILAKREVKAYIDAVFFNTGFNNRFQMRSLMDTIIKKKLQDMDEADTSSTKDITEIMALSHKMTIELMDKELQLEKLRQGTAKVQTNIQINNDSNPGSNYASLLQTLMNNNV